MSLASPVPQPEKLEAAYKWRFFKTPLETWQAMYEDCQGARYSIEFEQYIFERDELGERFMELFIRKAREGVRVFLLLDKFGSLSTYFSPRVRELRRSGGRVYFFNPIGWWHLLRPWKWFPRTHAKTMLIDSRIVYSGGVCFDAAMKHWRDTHIRITGPVAQEVRRAFDHLWQRFHGGPSPAVGEAPPVIAHGFRFATSAATTRRNAIYRQMAERIRHARYSITITSPFFIPSRRLLALLSHAARRGVEVMVLVSEVSDVRLADFVTQSYFGRLLKSGIRVFLYRGTVLHGKVVVVDEEWATMGSMNMDYLSLFRNRETNLIITESAAVAELAQHFREDLRQSVEVTPAAWQKWPWHARIIGHAGRWLRSFL